MFKKQVVEYTGIFFCYESFFFGKNNKNFAVIFMKIRVKLDRYKLKLNFSDQTKFKKKIGSFVE
jgi:hypothetical protein